MAYIHDDSYIVNSTISLDNSLYFCYLYLCLPFLPSHIYTDWQFLSKHLLSEYMFWGTVLYFDLKNPVFSHMETVL